MNKVSTRSADQPAIPYFTGVVKEVKRRKPAVVVDGRVKILVPRKLIVDGDWKHKFVAGAKVKGLFVFGGGMPHLAVNIQSVV